MDNSKYIENMQYHRDVCIKQLRVEFSDSRRAKLEDELSKINAIIAELEASHDASPMPQ